MATIARWVSLRRMHTSRAIYGFLDSNVAYVCVVARCVVAI
jgi:hypothetical protein